jgi:hypothetical protein
MPTKLLVLQAALYTGIAALTPAATALASDMTLTARSVTGLIIGCIIAGGTALKAFLSTTFSDSELETPSEEKK